MKYKKGFIAEGVADIIAIILFVVVLIGFFVILNIDKCDRQQEKNLEGMSAYSAGDALNLINFLREKVSVEIDGKQEPVEIGYLLSIYDPNKDWPYKSVLEAAAKKTFNEVYFRSPNPTARGWTLFFYHFSSIKDVSNRNIWMNKIKFMVYEKAAVGCESDSTLQIPSNDGYSMIRLCVQHEK